MSAKRIPTILFFAILLFGSTYSFAQFTPKKIFVKNLNLKDGISQCVITDIAEDENGFIWISTFDGLNRFDGYKFKVFRNIIKDTNSLPSSKIFKIFADQNEHLWLNTSNGFCIFNTHTGKIIKKDWLENIKPFWLTGKDDKTAWLATKNNGIQLIDLNKLTVLSTTSPIPLKSSSETIFDLRYIGSTIYCASSAGHVYEYNTKNKKWLVITNPFANDFTTYEKIEQKDNNIIYLASVGADLLEYNVKTKQIITSEINRKKLKLLGINDLHQDATKNILYISTYGQGLFVYDYSTNSLRQFKQRDEELNLSANYPLSLQKDKSGVLWIGYDGRGIDILDPSIKKFSALKKEGKNDLYSLKFVRKIVEGNNNELWFATAGSGLVNFNRTTKAFSFYNTENLLPNGDNFIIEMLRVNNQLWLGFNGEGVGIFDLNTKRLIGQISEGSTTSNISNGDIWSFLLTNNKKEVLIGTRYNGLNIYQLETKSIEQYTAEEYPIFDDNGIRCMHQLADNSILLGLENGLFKFDRKNKKFKAVFSKLSKKGNDISIKSIFIDANKNIWLGTDGSGLVILDQQFKLIQHLSSETILKNNVIYGILAQSDKSYWISSNAGLTNLEWTSANEIGKSLPNVFNYDLGNGLQSNEYNTGAFTKLKDGSLAFGGVDGVDIFQGQEVKPNQKIPNTIITEFSIFNNELESESLVPYIKELKLKYRENSFSLKYNTLGFTIPEKTKYKYQLIGYDEDWIEAESRTYASYTNLNPGSYEFRVKASNYDGYWGEDYASLKIEIATPFHKTIWFYLLMALAILLIIYLIYRNRINQFKAQEKIKSEYTKEIAEVEMKALRAQINPHFLFNSLNSINNFILKNDNTNARKYLVKFSQLVRNILNNSSTPFISLQEELETIELYMQIESMRFDNQFSFNIDSSLSIHASNIAIPSLLLQPYIENAIWHGLLHKEGAKRIEIVLRQKDEENLEIQIIDNGIGQEAARKLRSKSHGKSFGMQLGANRIKLMSNKDGLNGTVEVIDLKDENQQAIGTKINITLPILEATKPNSTN